MSWLEFSSPGADFPDTLWLPPALAQVRRLGTATRWLPPAGMGEVEQVDRGHPF